MSQIQTLILAIGAFQGFLLFTLLVSDKRVNFTSKLLGLQCLFIATTFVLPLIVAAGNSGFSWLIGFLLFLPASSGALIFLYCRSAITGSTLKPGDVIHLLPLLTCYLLNYDILFSSEKAIAFVKLSETTLFRHTLTKVVFYGQALIYLALLMRMLNHFQNQARQTLSSYNPDIFRWLWSLVGFMAAIWGLKVVFYFFSLEPMINTLADLLLVLMVYFIAIVQWRNPGLFHIKQLEDQIESRQESQQKESINQEPTIQEGLSGSIESTDVTTSSGGLLDDDMRSSILQLVKEQVEKQALYRNSELTLSQLAQQVGVSVHQLSETLNQYGGKNFNRFINEYRVAEVCQQLEQKSDRNLIDIALDAGFSSKSSFNSIFKKLTGQTPSLYRRQAG